jgi:hypothetical protein
MFNEVGAAWSRSKRAEASVTSEEETMKLVNPRRLCSAAPATPIGRLMAKDTKTNKRFKLELEFYTRGSVKKIPSVNYSYNYEAKSPGIDGKILDSPVFTAFYDASDAVAKLLKSEGLI